ncbi:MAG: pyruvate kinase [Nitrospirota bacterium]
MERQPIGINRNKNMGVSPEHLNPRILEPSVQKKIRRTKIICTIGPATCSEEMIEKLINRGMDVARINFSHGKREAHAETIDTVRMVSKRLKRPVAIMQDIQGPKIRIGTLKDKEVRLKKGDIVILTSRDIEGTSDAVSTTYKGLVDDIKEGERIFINDGLIQLDALEIKGDDIVCKVVSGGILTDHKGINIPDTEISIPSLTEKDREDILFGIQKGVDYIALSFVKSGMDIEIVKGIIEKEGYSVPLIAKIERKMAVENLQDIFQAADGVMIARGDLGVEMPLEDVTIIQKRIIKGANLNKKIVITATQMLESMIVSPRPTRAEVSDVTNAILDGSDGVMLSGETAVGKYPVESVGLMSRIIETAERNIIDWSVEHYIEEGNISFTDAVCNGAVHAAHKIRAKILVVFTQSGFTALLLSKYRPVMPIIAFTPHDQVVDRMNLYWGVIPEKMGLIHGTDEIIHELEERLLRDELVKNGDNIVITMGAAMDEIGSTNMMKIHKIGEKE